MKPKRIYFEPNIFNYELGKMLMEKYKDVPWIKIESHNRIEELQKRSNADFVEMKKYIIIGVRKTHKYVPNTKSSDFLVPYTSSGCSAMCMYCYLVCNYNKCSYLRIFVNVEQMLNNLIKKSKETGKICTFEIGSNSDLILENQITGNLKTTIERFGKDGRGFITFPTKFSMVDSILNLNHNGKTIVRMSLNPQEIITKVEFGTSNLEKRINAINKLSDAGYKVGILIAPVVFVDNWRNLYLELLDQMEEKLSDKVKESLMIEIIFMTYSYVHNAINEEAFPNEIKLYNKDIMTGRGMGKYWYKKEYRDEAEKFFREEIKKRFSNAVIMYIV
ncbi:MAG: SPL family radical SAM protein [Ignavibacteriales bacterium]